MDKTDIYGHGWARSALLDRATADPSERTIELAFSSESPYERWWGIETLSHDSASIDLTRLRAGANLLINHDPSDWVGVVENARVDTDRIGRARVRFGSSPRAEEIWRDVRDGILRSASVGYRIDEMVLRSKPENGPETYLVTRWTPLEISLVTVPADETVGIGRSAGEASGSPNPVVQRAETPTEINMTETNAPAAPAAEPTIEMGNDGQLTLARYKLIDALGEKHGIPREEIRRLQESDLTVPQVQKEMVKILVDRQRAEASASYLGMSPREVHGYSLLRAINAVINKSWSRAGLEYDAHQAIQGRVGKTVGENSFFVPLDIQARDLTVAAAAAGGYLVGTQNLSFIELLRNRSVALQMGARRMSGLVGNVTIPKQSASGTGYWLTNEATSITESAQTLGQLALSPKNVGAYTEISRQLRLQSSPDAEALVMADLAAVVALAVDVAVLRGSGSSGEPLGIVGTSGVGTVTGTSFDYADILEFQSDVASGNVMPMAGGYVTTPAVAALAMARARFSSTDTPLWVGNIWDGTMAGFRAMASNQMSSGTMLFGDWSEVILAEWGVLEVEANPFANFQAGITGIRAFYTVDVGVRHGAAFSYAASCT